MEFDVLSRFSLTLLSLSFPSLYAVAYKGEKEKLWAFLYEMFLDIVIDVARRSRDRQAEN